MASTPSPPLDRNAFKIAVICALSLEADMVESMFDRFWDDEKSYGKVVGDQNAYTTGCIGNHNVVLVHMPGMGGDKAATVAASLRITYTGIQIVFVVGVCGVVPVHPQTGDEIILGDCIISTAVVQYDFGGQYPKGFAKRNGIEDSLGRASAEIRSLTSMLKTRRNRQQLTHRLVAHLKKLQRTRSDVKYPGIQQDHLFRPSYVHCHQKQGDTCDACLTNIGVCSKPCDYLGCGYDQTIKRQRLQNTSDESQNINPVVHFGCFGSANTVMKSGIHRDRIAQESELVAFEMEGFGVWDSFPTIVIKSACDYADSHKNKIWQPYAAATAAAGLKALLEKWDIAEESSKSGLETTVTRACYNIPLLANKRFVGRERKLEELEERLLLRKECYELAIFGLGGVGKTQLALAFCYKVKEKYPEYSIFWVSATSTARLQQDYIKIAKACSIGTNSKEDDLLRVVQEYLSSHEAGKWLLVIDNTDDREVLLDSEDSILNNLPQSEAGITIFTTRYKDVAVDVGNGNVLGLEEMNLEEAKIFLGKSLGGSAINDEEAVEGLLTELTCLPLAISQASSYIIKQSITVSKYLSLMRNSEEEMIQLLSRDFRDTTREKQSRNAVAVTWLISFEQIRSTEAQAAGLLFFLALIENKAIPRSILPNHGSEGDLTHAIGVLTSYSFLTEQGNDKVYDMHRLVHLAVKIYMQKTDITEEWENKVVTHLENVFPSNKWEARYLWRKYTPHVIRILQDTQHQPGTEQRAALCIRLGLCIEEDGRISEGIEWVFQGTQWRVQYLPEDNANRLSALHCLAFVYSSNKQIKETVEILEKVVEIRTRVLLEDDLNRLASQHELARAYYSNGQIKEAVAMMEKVVEIHARLLVEEDPRRLNSEDLLYAAYGANGQVKEAVEILEKVVTIRMRALAEDHPSRLISEHNLAMAYESDGQIDKAISLMQHVVGIRRSWRADHPDRIASEEELARMISEKNAQEARQDTIHG